jgi:hypothetical protein
MASTLVPIFRAVTVTVPNGSKLATYSADTYRVDSLSTFANYPPASSSTFASTGANTTAAYTADTAVTITAGSQPVYYNVGTGPVVYERVGAGIQPTPGTLNSTGTLTAALLLTGTVTSTTAAGVTATLDTGALMDAAAAFAVDDSFDWTVINTGGNTLTVTASTGHTIVGTATVVTVVSARFRTRKTAANTFVTYRLS